MKAAILSSVQVSHLVCLKENHCHAPDHASSKENYLKLKEPIKAYVAPKGEHIH